MSEPVEIEATGETVGEARWAAIHELERRFPDLDRGDVEFVVLSEGARGLLGVGYEPARVLARLEAAPPERAPRPSAPPAPDDEGEAARCVREVLGHVIEGLGLDGELRVEDAGERVTATVLGSDLGVLIGRHGQTIDAVQHLTNAIAQRRLGAETPEIVVDAQGYRARRERMLHQVAITAAVEAKRTGRAVALDPMTAAERKVVHMRLKDEAGVRTESAGADPHRYVVVLPED